MGYIAKLPNWMRWVLLPVTFLIASTLSSALFYFFMVIAPVGYMPENLIVDFPNFSRHAFVRIKLTHPYKAIGPI